MKKAKALTSPCCKAYVIKTYRGDTVIGYKCAQCKAYFERDAKEKKQ